MVRTVSPASRALRASSKEATWENQGRSTRLCFLFCFLCRLGEHSMGSGGCFLGGTLLTCCGAGGLWAILASVPHLHKGVVLQLGAPSPALGPSQRGVHLCPEEPGTQPLCGCRDLLMYLRPPSCLHTDRPFSRRPSDRWADHCPITPHPCFPGASSPTNSPSLIYSRGVFSLGSGQPLPEASSASISAGMCSKPSQDNVTRS